MTELLNAVFLALMNKQSKSFIQCVCVGAAVLAIQSCTTTVPVKRSVEGAAASVPLPQEARSKKLLDYSERAEAPGIATTQGRDIRSRVDFTSFKRQSSKPSDTAVIYYNDKEGVNAITGGVKYSGSGMQSAAGKKVEWGVKSGYSYLKNHHAKGKRFVIGKKGEEYSIVVKNKAHSRLEFLISVDGLNVLNGKEASYKQRGYVVEPGKTLVVKGYRTSRNEVAAFKFSGLNDSVTNQLHGKTRNVGVIGLAVFPEKGVSPWRWTPKLVKKRFEAEAF